MSTTFINRGHFYAPHVKPVLLDCNFVVDPANGNGLGIRSLKGQGVKNVFMHTSATPGAGAGGIINPNPASGYIAIQLADNYFRYYGGFTGFISPLSGSSLAVNATALTVGVPYVIVSVGTTTYAQWLALGMQPGIAPAVGVTFIAAVTGVVSGGSGAVQAIAAAGANLDHLEVVGDPNTTINPGPVGGSPNVGGWIYVACFTSASGGGEVVSAPATNSVIGMSFYMSQSSVVVSGE